LCDPCFKLNYEALLLAIDLISPKSPRRCNPSFWNLIFMSLHHLFMLPECCKSCGGKKRKRCSW